jgi:hypothetical protein
MRAPSYANQGPSGQGQGATSPTSAGGRVPFDQASHRGVESGPVFVQQLGNAASAGSSVVLGPGPNPLPAQGYVRGVLVDLQTTTAGVAGTANGDYPFNILQVLRLHDTNGATLYELNGFNSYLATVFGGYFGMDDPATWPDFSSSVTAPSAQWWVPVEIDPNGFGVLANQSASAAYKLDLTLEATGTIYSANPTTNPIFTIKVFIFFWTLPGAADMLQRPQAQFPPYHGVAQYWTQSLANSITVGSQTTRVTRTGNLYRTLIFVARSNSVTRAANVFPDPIQLKYDTRDLFIITQRALRAYFFPYLTAPSTTFLTGVFPFIFSYGRLRTVGSPGFNSWLPTVAATRLEIVGSSAGAGALDIVSNDVAVAETSPAQRAVETSATGYHPPVAPVVMGAQ